MSAPVFVDSNVLLYARDAGAAAKQPRAADWLAYLWREQLGRTSMQVLSEYYVNATCKLSPGLPPADAWDDVEALMTWHPQRSTSRCCGVVARSNYGTGSAGGTAWWSARRSCKAVSCC